MVAALHIYPFLRIFCLTHYIRCVLNGIHSSLLHIITLTWGQGLNQDCLRARTERVILIFLSHWNTKCIVSLLISLPVIVCNSEVIYNKGFDFQHEFLNSSRTDHIPCVTFFRTRIANELRVSKIMPPMDLSITSLNLAGNSIHEYWIFFECTAYFIRANSRFALSVIVTS